MNTKKEKVAVTYTTNGKFIADWKVEQLIKEAEERGRREGLLDRDEKWLLSGLVRFELEKYEAQFYKVNRKPREYYSLKDILSKLKEDK